MLQAADSAAVDQLFDFQVGTSATKLKVQKVGGAFFPCRVIHVTRIAGRYAKRFVAQHRAALLQRKQHMLAVYKGR